MKKSSKVNVNSAGGPVFLDKVHNQGIISGRTEIHNQSANAQEMARLFDSVYKIIDRDLRLSVDDKYDLKGEVSEIQKELTKKEKANESFLLHRLRNIKRIAPDILEVTLAVITNPAAGFGVVARKIAERVKSTAT